MQCNQVLLFLKYVLILFDLCQSVDKAHLWVSVESERRWRTVRGVAHVASCAHVGLERQSKQAEVYVVCLSSRKQPAMSLDMKRESSWVAALRAASTVFVTRY